MQKVTKAIILAGGVDLSLIPGYGNLPKSLLPVGNLPLIYYSISNLKRSGVNEIFITCNSNDERRFKELLASMEKEIHICYISEQVPKGTAGAIRHAAKKVSDEHFWVLQGGLIVDLDLMRIAEFHQQEKAMVTIVANRSELPTEGISFNDDGEVDRIHLFHKSRDRRKAFAPSGIYLLNRGSLDYIDSNGYYDLKEQLIPKLREYGQSVRIFETNGDGYIQQVRSMSDYYASNLEVVESGMINGHGNHDRPYLNRVWTGKGTFISPSSQIVGPVLIGKDVKIGINTVIIGPAVIGDNVSIEDEVLLRESVVLSGSVIPEKSVIEYSIYTPEGEKFNFKKNGHSGNHHDGHDDIEHSLIKKELPFYNFLKRIFDIFLSITGLVLLFPLFLFIILAIRIDSPGPACYTQRRCGINGREFLMIKFRTMVYNADKFQDELFKKKDVDGPVFKMKHDPRITRIGGFLRRTSLDELTQLWNVLKGDMSLVGPRPLVMEEMRFNPRWRDIRLLVRPGITGLWQINGRGETSFYEWIQHDILYVLNRSLYLDVKVLLRTAYKTIRRIGAY